MSYLYHRASQNLPHTVYDVHIGRFDTLDISLTAVIQVLVRPASSASGAGRHIVSRRTLQACPTTCQTNHSATTYKSADTITLPSHAVENYPSTYLSAHLAGVIVVVHIEALFRP